MVNSHNEKFDIETKKAIFTCEKDKLEIVKYLCAKWSSLEAKDCYWQTSFHFASLDNHLNVAEYLIEKQKANNNS